MSVKRRDDLIRETVRGRDVLDVGFVDMFRTLYLHKEISRVAKVTGIDTDSDGIKKGKHEGLDVYLMDAEKIKFNKKFDAVVACDVVEHLNNFGLFLVGAWKHLKTDGELIITTNNPNYWRLNEKNSGHTCRLSFATLEEILRRHGFVIMEKGYTKGEYYPKNIDDFLPFKRFKDTIYVIARKTKKPTLINNYVRG